MWFLGVGVLLLLMKWFEIGPVANWSWLWVIAPFILAMVWFEVIEPMLGLDKKKMHDNVEKNKQERVRKALERGTPPRR
jgi:small Trp-rich protein